MRKGKVTPINEQSHFGENEIIVSKTDLKGHITYANDVFCRIAELTTSQCLGEPHSIIRHPDMPRAVFSLLWDTLAAGHEIFAYVKNMTVSGKYYWVFAHVTPSYDGNGKVIGYHSNRRKTSPTALAKVEPLYRQLLQIENSHSNKKEGMKASVAALGKILEDAGVTYDQFVWSLGGDDV